MNTVPGITILIIIPRLLCLIRPIQKDLSMQQLPISFFRPFTTDKPTVLCLLLAFFQLVHHIFQPIPEYFFTRRSIHHSTCRHIMPISTTAMCFPSPVILVFPRKPHIPPYMRNQAIYIQRQKITFVQIHRPLKDTARQFHIRQRKRLPYRSMSTRHLTHLLTL